MKIHLTESECWDVWQEWIKDDLEKQTWFDTVLDFVCKAVDSKGTRQFGKKQAAMMLYELFKVGLYPEYWSVKVDRDVWCHNMAQALRRNLIG